MFVNITSLANSWPFFVVALKEQVVVGPYYLCIPQSITLYWLSIFILRNHSNCYRSKTISMKIFMHVSLSSLYSWKGLRLSWRLKKARAGLMIEGTNCDTVTNVGRWHFWPSFRVKVQSKSSIIISLYGGICVWCNCSMRADSTLQTVHW